jgi:hypothetical protein
VIAWCKTQEGRTYHSPLESVRAEPALLPAAAEAKEAGAIVVVEVAEGTMVCRGLSFCGGGERQTDWGQLRRFEGDVKPEAVLGLTGGGEWHSRVVVQANGRDSRGMATDERIPLPAAK